LLFDGAQRAQARALELVDPALLDLVQRDRVEVVQLLAPAPDRADQVGGLQHGQVPGGRLARHADVSDQLAQGLAVALVQPVEQVSPGEIAQRPEHVVHLSGHDAQTLCR
jgi:hypothetical protein